MELSISVEECECQRINGTMEEKRNDQYAILYKKKRWREVFFDLTVVESYLLISVIYNLFRQYRSIECNNNIAYYIIDTKL